MDWTICEGVPLHPGSLPRGLCGLHCETFPPCLPFLPKHGGALQLLAAAYMCYRESECQAGRRMCIQTMLQVWPEFLLGQGVSGILRMHAWY